jgi:VCBS repeat-containing protein
VATGGATADPGTGKKYLADPARVGPVTGSPLPPFVDSEGNTRDHNIFRIEVHAPNGGPLLFAQEIVDFTIAGRLMDKAIPGNIAAPRSTYKGDASGNVLDLDVYAKATSTLPSRLPAQPVLPKVTPTVSFYAEACGGALTTDPDTGLLKVNPGPYTAPASASFGMAATGNDFWGQTSPGGLPPSHVCIEDTSSRNLAGQIVPSYTLVPVTDQITITTAHYVGPDNGTLSVNAVSSDPTAILTLAGYGPGTTPGVSIGQGAGTGLQLAGGAAQVLAMAAPPSKVQVVSTTGGSSLRETDTAHGTAILVGIPSAVNDSATTPEDCTVNASLGCAAGQGVAVDLLANDTIMLAGTVMTLRDAVAQNLAAVTISAQTPRLGAASVSADGILTYTPNPNAFGTDSVNYTVAVDGNVSNQAVVSINITPVNDLPVAASVQVNAVVNKLNVINLLSGATDPDGAADVKNAVITSWPVELGPQPTPVNGVVNFTPTASGPYPISYQVIDAAGATSANVGVVSAVVVPSESLTIPNVRFVRKSARWTMDGTDTVRAGQTLTIAYTNGTVRSTGQVCDGTAAIPACVVATTNVTGTGTWAVDFVAPGGSPVNPTNTQAWLVSPTSVRVFSSSPELGGSATNGIDVR